MSLLEHHAVSILIARPALQTFAFMADPARLGNWAFENGKVDATGLATGTSRYDGGIVCARVDADPQRLHVDYHVGNDPEKLRPRIMAKIVTGADLDRDDHVSGLTLIAWRGANMDELRWRQLVVAHEMEILLIKSRIER